MLNIYTYINTEQKHISDWIEVKNGLIAHRCAILTTTRVVYEVYERCEGFERHSTTTSVDGYGRLGDITTRRLPAEIEALPPGTKERFDACDKFHEELESLAEEIIRQTFPKDFE